MHNSYGGANLGPGDFRAASPSLGADDKSIALLVQYVGTSQSGTVEVNATGDILFKHGAVGSEAADTTVGLPTLDGTIDVQDASALLIGQVVDNINASANWVAVMVDSIRGDDTTAKGATTIGFLDEGPNQAKIKGGLPVYWDTSLAWRDRVLVAPAAFRNKIEVYKTSSDGVDQAFPFKGYGATLKEVDWRSTYGSGDSFLRIYAEPATATDNVAIALRQVYEQASGATTVLVNKEFESGLRLERNARVLVAIDNSAAQSVVTLNVNGEFERRLN